MHGGTIHYFGEIFLLIFHMFFDQRKTWGPSLMCLVSFKKKSRANHEYSMRYTYFSTYRSVFGTIHSTRLVLRIPGAYDIEMSSFKLHSPCNILKFNPKKFRPKILSFDMVRTLVFEVLNSWFLLGFDTFSYL